LNVELFAHIWSDIINMSLRFKRFCGFRRWPAKMAENFHSPSAKDAKNFRSKPKKSSSYEAYLVCIVTTSELDFGRTEIRSQVLLCVNEMEAAAPFICSGAELEGISLYFAEAAWHCVDPPVISSTYFWGLHVLARCTHRTF
jgi:hypothetical protein